MRQLRAYYGVTRVLEDDRGWRLLVLGSTVHGAQDPAWPRVPLTYYAPGGPLADVVGAGDAGGPRSIGVIGLGAGSMAAYAEPGDQVTCYEIDPAVIELPRPPRLQLPRRLGRHHPDRPRDGRLTIAGAGAGVHDLVVVDAFSSDAIPVHLVTRDAVATYRRAQCSGRSEDGFDESACCAPQMS